MIERVTPDGRRLRDIVNEVTGRRAGLRIEHPDGRVDAVAAPQTRDVEPEQVGLTRTEARQISYGQLRRSGMSHEVANYVLSGVRHK